MQKHIFYYLVLDELAKLDVARVCFLQHAHLHYLLTVEISNIVYKHFLELGKRWP